jgi:hypothetical protein
MVQYNYTKRRREMANTTTYEEQTIRHYKYLLRLRNSGVTNMYGAGPYIMRKFGVERKESHVILGAWMDTFDLPEDEQPNDGRKHGR